jgi:uncharacterized protein
MSVAAVERPGRPPGMPLARMQWLSLLFIHWPVPAEEIQPLVPPPLRIDTFGGVAWVGLVPFTMRDVSPVGLPRIPIRGITDFHECNVRTYVTLPGVSAPGAAGVYFFSLDAASRIAVWAARRFFHLPYFHARMSLDRRGDEIDYTVDRIDMPRASMRCRWRAGRPLPTSQPGELAYFLTERYSLFTIDRAGRPRRCRIWHAPWPLREAELLNLDDSLLAAAGMAAGSRRSEPVLHHADALTMRAWPLERM